MHDLVSFLPLELIVQVVQHLDLEDVVRSQRVSKRWHMIFSCDTIIKPVLRQTLAFLGLDLEGITTDVAMANAMRYFRWQYGLQHARPVKKIFVPWPAQWPNVPDKVLYHSRRLCYILPYSNEVELFNLDTGERSNWTGSETGLLHHFSISDRYLVMVSREMDLNLIYLTAWNIDTKQKLDQQIPAFPALYMIIDGNVIIVPECKAQSLPVFVWDLSLNHIQEIGAFSDLRLCHMSVEENILVAFEVNWGKQPPEIQQTKWKTTTGQLLERKIFHLPMPFDCPKYWSLSNRGTWSTYGRKSVAQLFLGYEKYAAVHLEYDHAVDRLSTRWIRSAFSFSENARKKYSTYMTPYLVYRWAKATGQPATYDAMTGMASLPSKEVLETRESFPRYQMSRMLHRWRQEKIGVDHGIFCLRSFGNREVFGLAGQFGIQLWFFNPSFVSPFPEGTTSHSGFTDCVTDFHISNLPI